jgi:(p)ppGpp synthase/HD superfamily hydrolase
MNAKKLSVDFEKAIRLLAQRMPISDENSRKPVLFHDIRVGVYLYEKNYSENIVLAGVLHDAIEWSDMSKEELEREFGSEILKIVLACTKDDSILDKEEKTNELITRCVQNGQDSLIVKAADIIDSFEWYTAQNNQDELQGHCVKNADVILKNKPDYFKDKIFDELENLRDKFSI